MKQQTDNVPTIYTEAAETIKTAILQGQYEALKGENRIQLAVYYSIGKYVSQNSRKGKWPPQKDTAWTAWIFSQQLKKHA